MPELDEQQRKARDTVGSDLGKSIIVSASAGAGKTSVLVERILKRCIDDRIPVNRILAVTFTKAAAEEMKKRLASGMHARLEKETDPDTRAYISAQLSSLSEADITTIDSWCLGVIEKYYNIIGLDPARVRNVIDGAVESIYRHEAFLRALTKLQTSAPDSALRLAEVFSARPESFSELEDAVKRTCIQAESCEDPEAYYDSCLAHHPHIHDLHDLPADILDAFFSEKELACETIDMFLGEMEATLIGDEKAEKCSAAVADKRHALSVVRDTLKTRNYTQFVNTLGPLYNTKTVPDTANEDYTAARKNMDAAVKDLINNTYSENILIADANETADTVKLFIDFVRDCAEEFSLVKQEHSCMDFGDMERFVLDILNAEGGETAVRIRDSYDEIMVDEFQDTSALQNAVIEKIARGDNVFRVGDVKQSIYRFRHARPSLMRSLLESPDQYHITLTHNYRSKESVVAFNNILFHECMNIPGFADTYREEDYVSIGIDAQKEDPVPVEFHLVRPSSPEEKRWGRADWTAKKILMLIKEGFHFRDIAVLVRAHAPKLVLRAAFDRYGIPYEMDTREGFYASDLCTLIRCMLAWMYSPGDDIALAAVLTSSYCGFSDEDLLNLTAQYPNLHTAVNETHPEITREGKELRAYGEQYGITALLAKIAASHNFYASLNRADAANFDYLYEKAETMEPTDPYTFLTLLTQGRDESSSEASARGRDDDTVTVTTIHQSKGLQYKVVILYSSSSNTFSSEGIVELNDSLALGMEHVDTDTRIVRPTVQYQAVRHANDLEDQQEYIRLLYVALTRARERMFIVDLDPGCVPDHIDRSVSSRRKGMTSLILASLARISTPYFKIDTAEIRDEDLPVVPQQKDRDLVDSLPHMPEVPTLPPLFTPSAAEFTALPALDIRDKSEAEDYGTRIHEAVASLPDTVWTPEDLKDLDLSPRDKQKLLHFAASDIYRRALTGQIHKEYHFFVIDRDSNMAIHGAMDFVSVNRHGIILIDFKTDHADAETIQNRYRDQLLMYRRALTLLYPDHDIAVYAYSFFLEQFIPIQ